MALTKTMEQPALKDLVLVFCKGCGRVTVHTKAGGNLEQCKPDCPREPLAAIDHDVGKWFACYAVEVQDSNPSATPPPLKWGENGIVGPSGSH